MTVQGMDEGMQLAAMLAGQSVPTTPPPAQAGTQTQPPQPPQGTPPAAPADQSALEARLVALETRCVALETRVVQLETDKAASAAQPQQPPDEEIDPFS